MVIPKSSFLIAMIGSSDLKSSLRVALMVVAVAAGIPAAACHTNRSNSQQTAAKSTERTSSGASRFGRVRIGERSASPRINGATMEFGRKNHEVHVILIRVGSDVPY